jgi:hypothetical protein
MSFTAPLWNELVFEKINELQLSQQEMFKHIANLSHRMTHLENRLTNVSSGLSLVLTHLHRETKEQNIINRPNPLNSSSTTPTLQQTVAPNTVTTNTTNINTTQLVLQRSNSHPSMLNSNIQNTNHSHLHNNTASNQVQSPITDNFTDTQYLGRITSVTSVTSGSDVINTPNHSALSSTTKDTTIVSEGGDIQNYIDDPEEGEWTKVSKRRK